MKPILIPSKSSVQSNFELYEIRHPYFYNPWHFHPELELTLIIKGYGQRQVGDSIENFYPGDLVLIGSNLPHVWKNDQSFLQNTHEENAQAIVLKFTQDFVGSKLLGLPEMKALKELILTRASLGVKLLGNLRDSIAREMTTLLAYPRDEMLLRILLLLLQIAKSQDYRLLVSSLYKKENTASNHRINKVLDYIMEHYQDPLTLDQLSSLIHMNKNAFCTFFKKSTGNSLFTTINSIRIAKACQQLIETDKSILQISTDVGFSNLSNFNRIFKKSTETSPLKYRKRYM